MFKDIFFIIFFLLTRSLSSLFLASSISLYIQIIAEIFFIIIITRSMQYTKNIPKHYHFHSLFKNIIIITIGIFSLFSLSLFHSYIFSLPSISLPFKENTGFFFYSFIILAAISEELLFREYLLQRFLAQNLSIVHSIMASAILFSLNHFGMGMQGISFSFIAGIILGFIRISSNSLIIVLSIHIGFNIISLLYFK